LPDRDDVPARLVADDAVRHVLDRRNGLAVVVERSLDEHERGIYVGLAGI